MTATNTPTPAELVAAVRAHAITNYESDGWDYVVECWSDEDLLRVVATCRTARGAIRKVRAEIRPLADMRAEVRAEIF